MCPVSRKTKSPLSYEDIQVQEIRSVFEKQGNRIGAVAELTISGYRVQFVNLGPTDAETSHIVAFRIISPQCYHDWSIDNIKMALKLVEYQISRY